MTTGLILSGGGARAAYQVGVLKAVAEILHKDVHNPFPIICGTSAGAINAMALAGRPGNLHSRVAVLESIWTQIKAQDIYRGDFHGVLMNCLKILYSFINPRFSSHEPLALLDNEPLREMLNGLVRFSHIDHALASGELEAIAITAMSYNTGKSVTFFQGNRKLLPWDRARRTSKAAGLTIDHLMASSALPTLFPATKLGDHYYGDGALRLTKPISPALHLGAKKIFVIGVSDNLKHHQPDNTPDYPPSIGQIAGHLLSSVFIDTIEGDIETLKTINRLVEHMPEEQRIAHGLADLKPVKILDVSPSKPIDQIAGKYLKRLPLTVRFFLYLTGASRGGGSGASLASYLLFEKGFCTELLELGFKDGMDQQDAIREFFEHDQN